MAKCPLCGSRPAKRACPALGRRICAVCCGTKRGTDIACPADCTYLAAAKANPPAVVQRRLERDMTFLLPFLADLSEAQYVLMRILMGSILQHGTGALPPLLDSDVAEGTAALAGTLETAGKGIIYQHQARAIPAQRLADRLATFVGELAREAGAHAGRVERDAAVALRQLSRAASAAHAAFPGDGRTAFLALLGRIMTEPQTAGGGETPETGPDAPSGLIIPG